MWYAVLITFVVDIGGLLLIYVLLRDRVRRATTADSQIAEIRDEVSRLLVELNQVTDRNIALVEERMTALSELLAVADKKLGLLRRESDKHDVGTRIYSRLAEGRTPREEEMRGVPRREEMRGVPRRADTRGMSPAATAGLSPAATAGLSPAATAGLSPAATAAVEAGAVPLAVELSETPSPRAELTDARQRVLMLHRAGFSQSLIASRVGMPLGEVELIIALEQRKGMA
jgi:hypothetical protein